MNRVSIEMTHFAIYIIKITSRGVKHIFILKESYKMGPRS